MPLTPQLPGFVGVRPLISKSTTKINHIIIVRSGEWGGQGTFPLREITCSRNRVRTVYMCVIIGVCVCSSLLTSFRYIQYWLNSYLKATRFLNATLNNLYSNQCIMRWINLFIPSSSKVTPVEDGGLGEQDLGLGIVAWEVHHPWHKGRAKHVRQLLTVDTSLSLQISQPSTISKLFI